MYNSKNIEKSMKELNEDQLMLYVKDALIGENGVIESKDIILACQEGMREVGNLFEKGEYFIGDLIFAGELMNDVVDLLTPYINLYTWRSSGKILLGTVEGDIHDIGKNIFKNMAKAAGFEVYDIGINQSDYKFVRAAKEIRPDIIGMSGVLTTTADSIRRTINKLNENINREGIKIIIGGSCVNMRVCDFAGADDYSLNAATGVEKCMKWLENKIR